MQLPGHLAATTLGDLLGALHRARASGVLELIETRGATSGRAHRLHLDEGFVSDVETGLQTSRLGDILERAGFLTSHQRSQLGRLARASTRRIGELLVSERYVTAEALGAALRHQMRERLDALFGISDAMIRFRVPRRWGQASIPLSPREFLHGRPRARERAAKKTSTRSRPLPSQQSQRDRALRVLGLSRDAGPEDVQRAFRRLAATAHPDRFPAASEQERVRLMRRFADLSAAYHLLMAR